MTTTRQQRFTHCRRCRKAKSKINSWPFCTSHCENEWRRVREGSAYSSAPRLAPKSTAGAQQAARNEWMLTMGLLKIDREIETAPTWRKIELRAYREQFRKTHTTKQEA